MYVYMIFFSSSLHMVFTLCIVFVNDQQAIGSFFFFFSLAPHLTNLKCLELNNFKDSSSWSRKSLVFQHYLGFLSNKQGVCFWRRMGWCPSEEQRGLPYKQPAARASRQLCKLCQPAAMQERDASQRTRQHSPFLSLHKNSPVLETGDRLDVAFCVKLRSSAEERTEGPRQGNVGRLLHLLYV